MTERPHQSPDVWDNKFGLPNAACLERDVLQISSKMSFTLICFDIVSLRTINDGYGRKVGDMLLFAVRDWIMGLNFGQLYRLEDDEFGMLLEGSGTEAALQKAERICERFKEAWIIGRHDENRRIFCAASVGVVPGEIIHSPDDILNVIERVLAIASKKRELAVYDGNMAQELRRRIEVEISLKSCVKNNLQGFAVHYQPIVNCITGLWCGVEALCRWSSPELGNVPPLEFIPLAEQLGLVGPIGEWVLETGVKQCKAWRLDALEDFFLDVNLSAIQLQDENLDVKVFDILKRHGYPCHKLSLEITESAQLNFSNHTLEAISRLTQHGIPVALDDFGTGYSSFNSLINLPVSVLKTEKAFLHNIENDDYLQLLLETMVSLAHASGMKMIAEGVENPTQMRLLMDNRVDYAQGYLFSKPLPSAEFEKKLRNFYFKDKNSIAGEYGRIDINSLLHSESAYSLTPSLYKTLIRCMKILFGTPDVNDGINTVLAVIGEKLGVNRHVLFLKDAGENTFTNTHEWCDEETRRNFGLFKSIDLSIVTPSFIPLFEKEGMIISPDVAALPEDIKKMFQGIGVKSNIAIPLWRGKELLGYVGLDVCSGRRNWLPEEVLMVHSVCGILANVLDRIHLRDEVIRWESVLHSVLNNMDMLICITDPDTDEILFTNDTLCKSLGASAPLKGKTCWKTIYGNNTPRCAFCKAPQHFENPEANPVVLEHAPDPALKRYMVYDCIIQWENNKKARLKYAIDAARFRRAPGMR